MRGHHEGTIYYSQAESRWIAAISLPDGRRKKRKAASQAEAREALKALQRESDAGVASPSGLTTGAYLRSWLADSPKLGPRTLRKRESIVVTHLEPALGRIPLRKLTSRDIERYLSSLERSPRTVNHVRAILRTALADAVRHRLIERNEAAMAKVPPVRVKERHWLAAPDARRLLDATKADRLHALYVVSLTTGLRQGEVLALGWDDVDLEQGSVKVTGNLARVEGAWVRLQTKNDKSLRTVMLVPEAVEALKAHRLAMAAERTPSWAYHGLVFVSIHGEPIHGPNLIPELRAYLSELGLPPLTWHDLRHSAASVMLTAGVPMAVISNILGHSTSRITADLYAHVGPELQRDAAERMAAALR